MLAFNVRERVAEVVRLSKEEKGWDETSLGDVTSRLSLPKRVCNHPNAFTGRFACVVRIGFASYALAESLFQCYLSLHFRCTLSLEDPFIEK
jgi:hypothetical protein